MSRFIPRKYMNRVLHQYYKDHETTFTIQRFEDGENEPPNIYGERVGKSYGNPIKALGYLEMDPTDIRLEELGWEKGVVEFIITTPFTVLVEAGLALEDGSLLISTDDKIHVPYMDYPYQLHKIHLREPFVNGLPTLIHLGGRKFVNG
jgi:hypothetical protein